MFRFWRKRFSIRVAMNELVSLKMYKYSQSKHPVETGGLLLGWWNGDDIIVVDLIEVPDESASHTSWVRREAKSQSALDKTLKNAPNNLGYVGDWHTHPATIRVSNTDLSSLCRSSRQYDKPIALAVHKVDGNIELHAAFNGKLCNINKAKE